MAVWAKEDNPRLTPQARSILENPDNEILVSQFSLIELSVKLKIGKLPGFIVSIETFIGTLISSDFVILPVSNTHIAAYQAIPLFEEHRDPFDRCIIATAHSENLSLISSDDQFELYGSFIDLIRV